MTRKMADFYRGVEELKAQARRDPDFQLEWALHALRKEYAVAAFGGDDLKVDPSGSIRAGFKVGPQLPKKV